MPVAFLTVFVACGSDGTTTPTLPPGTIDRAGGELVSSDGAIRITIPAGTVTSPTEMAI